MRMTDRAFVLHKKKNTVRTVLGEFLQNLDEVDGREEVTPRVITDHLDFLLAWASLTNDRLSCLQKRILRTFRLRILRAIEVTVSEETSHQ